MRELPFECKQCSNKFRTALWTSQNCIEKDGTNTVLVSATCPECDNYAYLDFGLREMFEMLMAKPEFVDIVLAQLLPAE